MLIKGFKSIAFLSVIFVFFILLFLKPQGALATSTDGSLVKFSYNPTVYLITSGTRRPFPSAKVFFSYGYTFSQVTTGDSGDSALPIGPIMPMNQSVAVNNTSSTPPSPLPLPLHLSLSANPQPSLGLLLMLLPVPHQAALLPPKGQAL